MALWSHSLLAFLARGPRNHSLRYRRCELDYFFRTSERVLVKVDVEGYEPDLMAAFKDIALRYRPDFLIEVLTGTAEALDRLDYLHAYERFLLTPQGPVRRPRLEVDQHHRDWLLRLPASPAG
jgi:hypothetical protein